MTTQIGNTAAGDLAGRDIVKNVLPALTGMGRLIREYASEGDQSARLAKLIQQLEHYYSTATDGDVRGLDEKLSAAGRRDQLFAAMQGKQYAAQFVLKHQSSLAAQQILRHLLAKLLADFQYVVTPLIQENAARKEVDAAIREVMDSAWRFLEDNPLDVDYRLLAGFLYFLGGNCHLRWDPC